MADTVVRELQEQFSRQWATLRDSVAEIPEGHWRTGENESLVPARLSYHILSGAEVYARSTTYEEFTLHRKYPKDWQTAPAADLPDKLTIAAGIDEAARLVNAWLESLGDEGLFAGDAGFPWTGSTKLGRAVYLLRHTQNHLGELNSELKRRGLPRGKWK